MNKLNKLFCAAALATIGTAANANNIIINTGTAVDFYLAPTIVELDGNDQTTDFQALTVDVTATSVLTGGYFQDLGDVDGDGDTTEYFPIPGVGTFSESGSGILTAFSGATNTGDTEALGSAWNISVNYTGLTGIFGLDGPVFDGGSYVDLVFNDLINGTSEQVLRLEVAGGGACSFGVCLSGLVSFDFMNEVGYSDDTAADPMTFFNFEDSVKGVNSFYDVWTLGQNVYLPLNWNMEFNVDDIPYTDQAGSIERTTDFTAEVRFNAPEPSSLAILALALIGFGASQRRKA